MLQRTRRGLVRRVLCNLVAQLLQLLRKLAILAKQPRGKVPMIVKLFKLPLELLLMLG